MDRRFDTQLDWIDAQQARVGRLVEAWARINSGSGNVAGLERCMAAVAHEFGSLGADERWIDLPPQRLPGPNGSLVERPLGRALHLRKRPDAARRVLLAIHADTVYGPDDPFQDVTRLDPNTLRGPGVVDAKGGLAVMLLALEALERSPVAGGIGWDVLINPDEELGSPGSGPVLASLAKECGLGLLFEPALPDGALVSSRKGSGNFTAVVTGRAAHAGRDPHLGRNAIHSMGELIVKLAAIGAASPGITVNVGRVEGGGAANVVPDRAECRFNVRVATAAEQRLVRDRLAELSRAFTARDGFGLAFHGEFTAPPKPSDDRMCDLEHMVSACGRDLGMQILWRATGGTCDGNRLAAAGLPNVDSLGPRGGNLHSPQEFLLLDSLAERAKLSALLLMKLAAGELPWPQWARRGRD